MRSVQVTICSEQAFLHFSGMPFSPAMMPSREASEPAVQTLSSPQFTARQTDFPKSPSPYSQPMRMMPMLAGAP